MVTLLNIDDKVNSILTDKIEEFEGAYNVYFNGNSKIVSDIASITSHMISEKECSPEWGGYFAIDEETRVIVGTCAFKGHPNEAGEVEIAFFTFPKYEGRGYGTMIVEALVNHAATNEQIKLIFANSLPEHNAATRVLEKCGWNNAGERNDEEDGTVWRWEFFIVT